jgi:hypothetical protein
MQSRLSKLEAHIKPPGIDVLRCWLEARKQGLYCDIETGEPITFGQLQECDPKRALRLQSILEMTEDD